MRRLADMPSDETCPLCGATMEVTRWNDIPGRRIPLHRECPNLCKARRPEEYNEAVARRFEES